MGWVYALVLFGVGAGLAVAGTERLLKGLVGVARLTRRSTFTVAVLLSGLEAENIAVGLAAGARGSAPVALGSVYGGSIFLLCAAVGVGALVSPITFRLPRRTAAVMVGAAVASGLPLLGTTRTPRWTGGVLLVAAAAALWATVRSARSAPYEPGGEVAKEWGRQRNWPWVAASTVGGLIVLSAGGELVAAGATRMIHTFALPATLVGAVFAPAAVELEEIARQAVPAKRGHSEVAAANIVGTLVYFTLVNLGLVALFTPVHVAEITRSVDWPFLVGVTIFTAVLLSHGRLARPAAALLVTVYAAFVLTHLLVG